MSSKESVARARYYRENGTSVTSVSATGVPSYKRDRKSRNYSILNIILIILLVVSLFQILNGVTSQRLTFSGFLNWAKDFHPAFSNVRLLDSTITGSWGIFNFLRDFINLFIRMFDFMSWIAKTFANLISYLFGIMKFLFGI